MARKATLTDILTGEFKTVERGTAEYYSLVQEGWLSKEQVSHRKPEQIYPEEYQPDYIEPEETETDYPQTDIRDIIRDRIIDMYDTIRNILGEIPDEKQFFNRNGKYMYYQDVTEEKYALLQMLDDLYGQSEDDEIVNQYLLDNQDKIAELTTLTIQDSEADKFNAHITQLAIALNNGNAMNPEEARRVGDELDMALRVNRVERTAILSSAERSKGQWY